MVQRWWQWASRYEWLPLVLITWAGLVLRLANLGNKALSYDEAATALMARATPAEIIYFHWDAAFEHPPLWQLTMHWWSRWFGQSEAILRLLPALAGTAMIPLAWWWLRVLWPERRLLRGLAAGLLAISPVMVLYSQEARMYTVVGALALLSLLATAWLTRQPGIRPAAALVAANWLMVGFHYYSLLLIGAEGLFLVLLAAWQRRRWSRLAWWLGALAISIVPIGLWFAFAPGFHETLAVVTGGSAEAGPSAWQFFDGLWRDLMFGSIRWQPDAAVWGFVVLPLAILGLAVLLISDWRPPATTPWSWLVTLIVAASVGVSALFFRSLATRYILFAAPALFTLIAAGCVWLGQRSRVVGVLAVAAPVTIAVVGLANYYGPYTKSEYREMAAFLQAQRGPDEAVMLYAPRQHLLAKYYLPAGWTYETAPTIKLPAYWPVTAPRVVPEKMDGRIQSILGKHSGVWLVATAENEVDPGEFVPKYLTAVSYKLDCWKWLDVELCHFLSPHFGVPDQRKTLDVLFNRELRLQGAAVQTGSDKATDKAAPGGRYLLAQLDWLAEQKPTVDYRVTLRLLDQAGTVVAQRDEFPIGALLPPTTWNAGDAKPGYLALSLPATLPPGAYRLVAGVYDPSSGALFGELVDLAAVKL